MIKNYHALLATFTGAFVAIFFCFFFYILFYSFLNDFLANVLLQSMHCFILGQESNFCKNFRYKATVGAFKTPDNSCYDTLPLGTKTGKKARHKTLDRNLETHFRGQTFIRLTVFFMANCSNFSIFTPKGSIFSCFAANGLTPLSPSYQCTSLQRESHPFLIMLLSVKYVLSLRTFSK